MGALKSAHILIVFSTSDQVMCLRVEACDDCGINVDKSSDVINNCVMPVLQKV